MKQDKVTTFRNDPEMDNMNFIFSISSILFFCSVNGIDCDRAKTVCNFWLHSEKEKGGIDDEPWDMVASHVFIGPFYDGSVLLVPGSM